MLLFVVLDLCACCCSYCWCNGTYLVTDNVKPYVKHDFPFEGMKITKERVDNLLTLKIDNTDAFNRGPSGARTSILKGEMYKEMRRRIDNSKL